MSVGYATIYGDMCGGLNPIGDIYKTEVFDLSRFYNKLHGKEMILNSIIDRPPSAELRPDQKDEDSLPPYPVLDCILKSLLENTVDENLREAFKKYTTGPDGELTLIKRIVSLVENAEFKRKQAAPIVRCQKISFGFGRNMPIVQKFSKTNLDVIAETIQDKLR